VSQPTDTARALQRAIDFFEAIRPEDAQRMSLVYTEDAWFKDPFNEVVGPQAIGRIFAGMFEQLHEPRFTIRESLAGEGQAFLTWDFDFRFRRFDPTRDRRIRGATHLRFAADDRIAWHRDYWDAAEELYEQLPGVGSLMRWLKRRAAH
jgi:steroid Delta-isomerase